MNRSIRQLLSITLVLLLTGTPIFAQRGGGARTSVNRSGSVNRNVNVNSNRNVNVNVHHDVDVHHSYYYGGCCYHNTAAVVATTAIVTAAVIGTRVYALPPACSVVIVNGLTYQQCGSSWYQPQFVGTTTTYVVVAAPR